MPSDIILGDDDITIEGARLKVRGDLHVATGLYLGTPGVTIGSTSTLVAVHEVVPELLAELGRVRDALDEWQAIRNWNVQGGWRWCNKCRTLVHRGTAGVCQVDRRPHTHDGSGDYHLPHTRTRHGGQDGWRWCDRCSSLYFGKSATAGRCPAGGEHNRQASSLAYFLVSENGARDFRGQNDWRWCRLCESLFYGPHAAQSACAGGPRHDGAGSTDYVLDNR